MPNNVQSVGKFTMTFIHPNVGGGVAITLRGFKLEETFLDATPLMDNAKVIALIDGTITVTNAVRAGTLAFKVVRVGDVMDGDLVAIYNELIKAGDSTGATLRIVYEFNGKQYPITFFTCCVKTGKPIILAGNDVNSNDIEFTYADWDSV
jgi:hypothetical protein